MEEKYTKETLQIKSAFYALAAQVGMPAALTILESLVQKFKDELWDEQ